MLKGIKKSEKEKQMKNSKLPRGITLISLVITIIVLLILAGVSIAMLTGENGILTKVNDAKKETEIASVKEQAQLDIISWITTKLKEGESTTISTPEKIKEILEGINQNNDNKYYKGFTDTGITTPNGYEVPFEELYSVNANEIVKPYGKGDVNYDGVIDEKDLELISNHILGKIELEGEEFKRADVNEDNIINISDSTIVKNYIQGNI